MKPATIIYWFPQNHAGPMTLGDSGLTAIPEAMRPRFALGNTRVDNAAGPDSSRRGLLVTWQEDVLVFFDGDAYAWRRCGTYWVGVRKEYTPEDLARPVGDGRAVAEGYDVLLGDGKRWRIPVALADAPHYGIPWRETLDADGSLVREPDPHYTAVCRAAGILYDHIDRGGLFAMREAELRLACANALQVNYRIDLQECLILGLFTSESYRAIVAAILDLDALEELARKKAAEGPGIASGALDSSDTTAPPGQTSP